MGYFPERNGNVRKIISRVSEKRSIGFKSFLYLFLLVHDYLFDDPTCLEYICKDFFRGIFCYILGVKVTEQVSLILSLAV